jgi:hypothetical protein
MPSTTVAIVATVAGSVIVNAPLGPLGPETDGTIADVCQDPWINLR